MERTDNHKHSYNMDQRLRVLLSDKRRRPDANIRHQSSPIYIVPERESNTGMRFLHIFFKGKFFFIFSPLLLQSLDWSSTEFFNKK